MAHKKKIAQINNVKLKMIDLCAGTGAFSYVLSKTGKVDVVFANDIDESSKKIYDNNFNHKLTLENSDFRNTDHLNSNGAKKFSQAMSQILKNRGSKI
jgi:site-specific DNA-cytosine methylase